MNYFLRLVSVGACLAEMFIFTAVNPACAASFAIDHINVYEDDERVTENVVLIEYDGIIETCENGRCSLGQQFTRTPVLHRLREPLKDFEKWQEEYLSQRSKCLKDREGKKPGVTDECGSGEAAVLMYEKYKKEQAKNALYSKTIILPEIVDRSVYHADPKMPMGGMIGAFRCFSVDLKDAQIEKGECKKNETDTSYSAEGYVIFISSCPPCPKDAVCAPCLPDFIIISPKNEIIQYPDQMGPEDKVVLTNRQSGFSLGKKYKFRLKVPEAVYGWDRKNTFELVGLEPYS